MGFITIIHHHLGEYFWNFFQASWPCKSKFRAHFVWRILYLNQVVEAVFVCSVDVQSIRFLEKPLLVCVLDASESRKSCMKLIYFCIPLNRSYYADTAPY